MALVEGEGQINDNPGLQSYYASPESRIGYRLVLGGTRHYGYWEADTLFPFPVAASLRRMEAKLFEVLNLPAGSRVLDAGCGLGHVALYMARRGMRITGIDVVDRHIVKARKNFAKAALPSGQVTVQKMDYHHLGSIPDGSHEGVYTMETFVHATDPDGVLAGFHRILRPGGRIAMFEYDNVLEGASGEMATAMAQVNEYAAMPTNKRPGHYKQWLEDAGFEDVVVHDYSENILPMLRLFWLLAIVPHAFVKLFGLEKYFLNTIAAYQGYRGRKFWRYLAVTATKPGPPIESAKTQ
ncbi:methyltransferase type 11 [Thozetella sp. PMI_491]|nr:methyltransferase type 11 [Thozetella sp. PMI_491]